MIVAYFVVKACQMDFLSNTTYGNTVEAYLVSIAMFVTSFFVWRCTYAILRRTFCEWAADIQKIFDKQSLSRLTHLFTSLIPVAAFHFAQRRLFFEKELSAWLNLAPLVFGQIVGILLLAHVLEPLAEVILIRCGRDVPRRDHTYFQTQKQSIAKVKTHIRVLTRILLLLIPGFTIACSVTTVPMLMWGVIPAITVLELVFCLRIIHKTKSSLKRERDVSARTAPEASTSLENSKPLYDPDLELKETIVNLFLDIYKHGLRALKDSPAEFSLVDAHSFAPNYIYQLRVMKDGDWQSRRMTIGPIGEDTGSRSKCFYVIYDHHLVIKIPPLPINDLPAYMEILKRERHIVEKLAMKECIVPSASVILKLVQPFEKKGAFPSNDREDDYLKFLNIFSELQKYLRIGNSFAFFMDLSKYYFLSHIIQTFHDTGKKIDNEIVRHSEVIGDYRKFQDRYGEKNAPLFVEIEKLYSQYESELKKLHKHFNLKIFPSRDQAKKWFFFHLVGKRVAEIDRGFSAEFIVEVNRLLERIIGEQSTTLLPYRNIITETIHETAISQNKVYMEGILANLLELLAHLHTRKVAMRDLKPDNLLVAGNKDKYPTFLAYPQEYNIGLIDVETAVILAPEGRTTIEQPPLGGTPLYATPSHFFTNNVLRHIYHDVPMVLHLQDWHGIIAIIYRTVTGLPLFQRAAAILTGILREKAEYQNRELEHFQNKNTMFWNFAVDEFTEKIAERQDIFRSLHVLILERARQMFKEFAGEERATLSDYIHHLAFHHPMPMSANTRQFLASCSHEKTRQVREKWESKGQKTERPQVIALLQNLELLKLRLEQHTRLLELLDHSGPHISAYELLEYMFNLVMGRLYGQGWKDVLPLMSVDAARETAGISSETTIEVTKQA